jgi:hypothetical protein
VLIYTLTNADQRSKVFALAKRLIDRFSKEYKNFYFVMEAAEWSPLSLDEKETSLSVVSRNIRVLDNVLNGQGFPWAMFFVEKRTAALKLKDEFENRLKGKDANGRMDVIVGLDLPKIVPSIGMGKSAELLARVSEEDFKEIEKLFKVVEKQGVKVKQRAD